MADWHYKLYDRSSLYRWAVKTTKGFTLPGMKKIPLYYIIKFFARQLYNEAITMRASAIAFNFFLALIPALIFFFSLIPFFPIDNLDKMVFDVLNRIMPEEAFLTIQDTLKDILYNKRGSLLSFGLILTLYFASNGLYSLMEAFNKDDTRSWIKKRLLSFGLFFALSIVLLLGLSFFVLGEFAIAYLFSIQLFEDLSTYYLLQIFQILMTVLIIFFGISLLYYVGTSPNYRVRFFSPGAFLATLLVLLTSYGFAFYVDNFSQYNKFYGSLGALIALMIWLYFNSIVLIMGYEFNKSILLAHKEIEV